MGLEAAIRRVVRDGMELKTPDRGKPFYVGRISLEGIVLELGVKRTATFFTWECLEGIPAFLNQHGKVRINGSGKSQELVPGTLDGYLKAHVDRLTAGWVAVLLETAGVVVIEKSRPARVRAAQA